MAFLWICTILGTIGGGLMLLMAILLPGASAPQQGAMAAVAVGCAVIPYVFTRAIESWNVDRWRENVLAALRQGGTAPVAGSEPIDPHRGDRAPVGAERIDPLPPRLVQK